MFILLVISGLLIKYSQATTLKLIMEENYLIPEAEKHDHRHQLSVPDMDSSYKR